jgi:hypothetical protein
LSLLGTLDTLSLPELFELLAAPGKTGALQVRGERGLGVVYFDSGVVCAGEAGEQSGPVADLEAVVGRLHDVCFELFRFEEGSFEFEHGRAPGWPVVGAVKVGTLVAETARRLDEWREITKVIPSLEVRPRLATVPPNETVTLDRAQWRVVTGIDGRRRVGALVRVLDGSEYEVCRLLRGLVEAGLVELDAAGDNPAPAEAPRMEEPQREKRRGPSKPVAVPAPIAAVPEAPESQPAPEPEAAPESQAAAEPAPSLALEAAAREVARAEEERRRRQQQVVDADGLNRGAVVAYMGMGNTRQR